jgi:hypothetical protein
LPVFVSKTFTDDNGQRWEISDAVFQEHAKPAPTPKPEGNGDDKDKDKDKTKSAFKQGLNKGWEHTKKIGSVIGKGLGYGISGLLPLGAAAGTAAGTTYGLYKLFSKDENEDLEIREID